ncbi:MAG: orotidine-5'-phosphate decarboxylase [Candidatus Omnitrophica bacterium]|nr:orotidine-5'-phosphate decarboxylase [Candidatus Omnitrophota bacterium]MBU1925362.1 orotidine-5'-phosphate decarboxylase [Candidatus Omnitrophota bacterium]
MKRKKTELIVALDTSKIGQAERIVKELAPISAFFKIGSQLFTACGPESIEMVHKNKGKVFLDLKFHDIPNTVAQAALNVLEQGVFMFNMHALGGKDMLLKVSEVISEKAKEKQIPRPIMLGVTVLTSMDRQQLNSLGVNRSVKNEVLHLARLSKDCGLDGVVCSGKELKLLRRVCGDDFILVVPGIRAPNCDTGDQKRIISAQQAAELGADYIVVGRPILAALNPLKAAQEIMQSLGQNV